MTDEMRIVYAGKRRAVAAVGPITAHVEFGHEAEVQWIEIRQSGTGGPMSGELISRYDEGAWSIEPSDEHRILIDHALSAWTEKNGVRPTFTTQDLSLKPR
jgi:hypothetical protein